MNGKEGMGNHDLPTDALIEAVLTPEKRSTADRILNVVARDTVFAARSRISDRFSPLEQHINFLARTLRTSPELEGKDYLTDPSYYLGAAHMLLKIMTAALDSSIRQEIIDVVSTDKELLATFNSIPYHESVDNKYIVNVTPNSENANRVSDLKYLAKHGIIQLEQINDNDSKASLGYKGHTLRLLLAIRDVKEPEE